MKKIKFILPLFAALLAVGCSGKAGEQGPRGEQGTAGTPGATGSTGADGKDGQIVLGNIDFNAEANSNLFVGYAYQGTHREYLGVSQVIYTQEGLVSVKLDEYYLPHYWAKQDNHEGGSFANTFEVSKDGLTADSLLATDKTIADYAAITSGAGDYAEFIQIGDKVFRAIGVDGRLLEGHEATVRTLFPRYTEINANDLSVKTGGISNLMYDMFKNDSLLNWYLKCANNGQFKALKLQPYNANEGSAETLILDNVFGRELSYHGTVSKSQGAYGWDTGYQGHNKWDFNANSTIDGLIPLLGTVTLQQIIDSVKQTADGTPNSWVVGETVIAGATWSDFKQYAGLIVKASGVATGARATKATNDAKPVIALIKKIAETVDLDEEDDIIAARKAYNALTTQAKGLVSNYKTLTDAEAKIKELAEEEAEDVIELIELIPTKIDSNAATAINNAREAYDDISTTGKSLVTNIKILTDAEAVIAANPVIELIKALPDADYVSYGDEEDIIEAREAYDNLKDIPGAQALVTNLSKLTVAEAAIAPIAAVNEGYAVTKLIKALPKKADVETSDEEDIVEAREAYDALSAAAKKEVASATLTILTNAEAGLIIAKADEFVESLEDLPAKADVETSDAADIKAAREAYDALPADVKKEISSNELKPLTEAEAALATAQADEFVESLKDLPAKADVETSDAADIKAAREAYEALSAAAKKEVSSNELKPLTEAEAALATAFAQADADDVIGLIDDIGEVDENSGDDIDAAREAYNALSKAAKAIVDSTKNDSNKKWIDVLTDAEKALVTALANA